MYQVYPRSFQDADGDGTGDLRGLRRRLPYLKELGVGFVWLSPVMRSPMRDFGYDISSFTTVDPLFGSMQDMHDLLEVASAAGIRILVDFVPNHSSNESAWFVESRSSKTNPKRNWYIWHPGKVLADGTRAPPNNWASNFGGGLGSSWTWDEVTQEYYYHAFGEFQPDLNYHNPEVVEAMQDVLRFWLKMGAAGFRIDAVPFLLEDPLLRDEPVNESCARELPIWNCMQHIHTQNSPANHDIIKGWRRVVDEFDERVMFGEIYAKPSEMVKYYGTPEEPEFNVPFNFEVLGINYGAPNDLSDAKLVRDTVRKSAEALPNWCHGNWVLGNHDNHRLMSRVRNNTILASTIYNFFNLLPGTPTIYNGDEVGMNDLFIPYDQCVDPMCLKNPTKFVIAGRDPERTPMQWSPGPQAGFSDGKHPWLPVNPNHVTVNVETESGNLSSPLSIMRRTLAFRGDNPDIALGRITHVVADESLSGHLAGRVVAAQFATEAAAPFAVTVGNWDSSQAIEVDLLTLVSPDVRSAPPPSWRVRFSTDPDQPVGASSAQRLRLSRGAVAVLAPGASA